VSQGQFEAEEVGVELATRRKRTRRWRRGGGKAAMRTILAVSKRINLQSEDAKHKGKKLFQIIIHLGGTEDFVRVCQSAQRAQIALLTKHIHTLVYTQNFKSIKIGKGFRRTRD